VAIPVCIDSRRSFQQVPGEENHNVDLEVCPLGAPRRAVGGLFWIGSGGGGWKGDVRTLPNAKSGVVSGGRWQFLGGVT
jgi:hypothetical protein